MKMFIRVMVGIALALVAIGFVVLMGFGYTWVIAFPAAFLSVVSLHEIQGVSGCKNKVLTACNMIFAGIVPFYFAFREQIEAATFEGIGICALVLYILAMLILMLKMYDTTTFENVANGLFASIAIPSSISTLMLVVYFLDGYPEHFSKSMMIYIVLMAMYCAWLSDAFALFGGMAFGKHKLSPKISPKKTVEGAISGIVGTTVFGVLTWLVCNHFYFHFDTIKVWMVIVIMPVVCIAGMCGDLAASVIKRNFGVKDFGTIFPEHGGMMDRIDSFLFTMPFTYVLVRIIVSIAY